MPPTSLDCSHASMIGSPMFPLDPLSPMMGGTYNTNTPGGPGWIGVLAWKSGSLLVSMLWVAILVQVIDQQWKLATIWALISATLSVFGIIHVPEAGFENFAAPFCESVGATIASHYWSCHVVYAMCHIHISFAHLLDSLLFNGWHRGAVHWSRPGCMLGVCGAVDVLCCVSCSRCNFRPRWSCL
jgi:hypothetical protein